MKLTEFSSAAACQWMQDVREHNPEKYQNLCFAIELVICTNAEIQHIAKGLKLKPTDIRIALQAYYGSDDTLTFIQLKA
jgi:TnpA family transposase